MHGILVTSEKVSLERVSKAIKLMGSGFSKTDSFLDHIRTERVLQEDLISYAEGSNLRTWIQIILAKCENHVRHILDELISEQFVTLPDFWAHAKEVRFPNFHLLYTNHFEIFRQGRLSVSIIKISNIWLKFWAIIWITFYQNG